MDDDNRIDSFDDLFEPFELDEGPVPGSPEPEPEYQPQVHLVACPSCGHPNPAHNRHCESCGARVAQGPLPVAPQPMLRTTPGARALGVLAGVILVVAVLALIVNFLRDSEEVPPGGTNGGTAASTSSTSSTSSTVPIAIQQLIPSRVQASSELPGFEASHLIDSDSSNSWNDASLRGVDAELQFFFDQPVQISEIVIQNLTDEARFHRNYRIEQIEITIDDLATPKFETLADSMDPQTVEIASLATTVVTIRVTSTYQAESWNGAVPFQELALQEIQFFGRPSPTTG